MESAQHVLDNYNLKVLLKLDLMGCWNRFHWQYSANYIVVSSFIFLERGVLSGNIFYTSLPIDIKGNLFNKPTYMIKDIMVLVVYI